MQEVAAVREVAGWVEETEEGLEAARAAVDLVEGTAEGAMEVATAETGWW